MVPVILKERIVKELVQGQDYASQLGVLLQKSAELDDKKLIQGDDLTFKILSCFSEALSLLGTAASDSAVASQVDSVCCEDSGDSRKRSWSTATADHTKPSSYKRKKTANAVTKVSPTLEDGHPWRKYGQKDILNAKYPRSYFRCSHKYDEGCTATKQVQRKEDDPNLYLITYIGTHSCSRSLKLPRTHIHSPSPPLPAATDYHNSSSSSAAPTIKEESNSQNSPTHHSLWNDVMPFDDHHTPTLASPIFDNMEFVIKSIDFFDTDFQYLDESSFNYL